MNSHLLLVSLVLAAAVASCGNTGNPPTGETTNTTAADGNTAVLAEIKEAVNTLTVQTMELLSAFNGQRDSTLSYTLFDRRRQSVVAKFRTNLSISRGTRLFLGDDIWDVTDVRVALEEPRVRPLKSVPTVQIRIIELYVDFRGKASAQPKARQ